MRALIWIPPLLTAIGVGLIAWVFLSLVDDALRLGIWRRRRTIAALERVMGLDDEEDESPIIDEAELYGLPASIAPHALLAGLIGLVGSSTLLEGPFRFGGLLAALIPLAWRRQRIRQARMATRRQVADLIAEMRLRLAFLGSLGAVLGDLADDERSGLVQARLRHHRHRLRVDGPEAVLETLAQEFRSPELRMLLRRIRGARRGAASYHQALEGATDQARAEILRRTEVLIEGAPIELLFPMLLLLFPPLMALALYPVVAQLLAQIATGGMP